MEPGYGSPVGAHDTVVVVDDAGGARSPNLVAGANRPGFHLRNVNAGRDFTPDVVVDIASARDGRPVPGLRRAGAPGAGHRGRQHLQARHRLHRGAGGHVPRRGRQPPAPVVMGSYGIGLGRALACIVEAHHDEKGIAWPIEVAPYRAHLVAIGANRDPAVGEAAEGALRAPDRRRRVGPVRRSRRVPGREVHRCRAARDADHRHRSARARWRPAASRSPTGRPASARCARSRSWSPSCAGG